mmetsp:Transcript_3747/g.11088  ORF Transcript_3747/g.11088 Transcript_3747/m.11088 type:complete len:250 (-) Transcript_3747:230-979(-)
MYSHSDGFCCSYMGTCAAPQAYAPYIVLANSARFREMTATRSPRSTPYDASALPSALAFVARSAYVVHVHAPVAASRLPRDFRSPYASPAATPSSCSVEIVSAGIASLVQVARPRLRARRRRRSMASTCMLGTARRYGAVAEGFWLSRDGIEFPNGPLDELLGGRVLLTAKTPPSAPELAVVALRAWFRQRSYEGVPLRRTRREAIASLRSPKNAAQKEAPRCGAVVRRGRGGARAATRRARRGGGDAT